MRDNGLFSWKSKSISQQLIEINEETTLGKISGCGSSEFAKRGRASQFFLSTTVSYAIPIFTGQ